jgi:tRNA pseudouridine38-40 synthase
VRVVLGVEYDGGSFAGWQSQAHGNTVQDVLEKALAEIAGLPVRVVCAGRTDAGVHAFGQVAHFDVAVDRPDSAWVRGVNSSLPSTVAVRWSRVVNNDFHARFSAMSRSYSYYLLNRPVRPGLLSGRVGWFHRPLDLEAMNSGLQQLIGEHDFSAFRAAECQAKSPVKHLHLARVQAAGEVLRFDFRASAFLHHMVRNIVGALIYVGKSKCPPQWIGELLESRDRTLAAPTFDGAGLYFAGVEYPPEFGLPAPPEGIILA